MDQKILWKVKKVFVFKTILQGAEVPVTHLTDSRPTLGLFHVGI